MAAPSSSHFSPGDLAVMKEYEIIMLIYNTKTCRLDLCFSAPEDIILHAI